MTGRKRRGTLLAMIAAAVALVRLAAPGSGIAAPEAAPSDSTVAAPDSAVAAPEAAAPETTVAAPEAAEPESTVAAPPAPVDSLTVTVTNGTGEALTDVGVFFLEEDNLLGKPLDAGASVRLSVPEDGCLYHVFGTNAKTKQTFRRYGVDLCDSAGVTLTPADSLPGGDARSDAEVARLLDVYLARAPRNFDGLVDTTEPPDDGQYDLRFYFPGDEIGDTYFVQGPGGRFRLRLEIRSFDDRDGAVAAVPDVCRWLASLPLAEPLEVGPGEGRAAECRLVPAADPESGVAIRVGVEPPEAGDVAVVYAEIDGGSD